MRVLRGIKKLFEMIILQSIEDIWVEREREHSLLFLEGGGFHVCAGLAGMDMIEQVKLLNLVNKAIRKCCAFQIRTHERNNAY